MSLRNDPGERLPTDGFLGGDPAQNLRRDRDDFFSSKRRRMIRFLYNLLFPLALLLFLPGYLVKMLRRGNYRDKFGQRLGFYDRETAPCSAPGGAPGCMRSAWAK